MKSFTHSHLLWSQKAEEKMDIIELVLQARQGDEDAFLQICHQYKNLLDSLSRRYSDMCPAEYGSLDDFSQEARVALYNAVNRYDAEGQRVTFGAFAKTCIRNRLVSYVRKLSSKKRKKGEGDAGIAHSWSVQDTVVRRELGEKLISLAEGILSKYEMKIFSYYLEDRCAQEIASLVGKDEKSVNNAIYRIRLKLKKTVF
jgi:RNA polymerase sporulation-specific sigma factor